MKPFSLEACIAGKPVVTRDGRPYDFGNHKKGVGIIGWINDQAVRHEEDGTYLGTGNETNNDLFMACEEREVWVNVYPDHGDGYHYAREEDARRKAEKDVIATIKLTYRVPEKGEEK